MVRPVEIWWEDLADAATLSGGSWQSTLPLANLQSRLLAKVARSTNVLATSTRLDVDLGASPGLVRKLGLFRHTLTPDATYAVTCGTTLGGSDVYASGTLPVWPSVFLPGDLEWEDDNWWTGQISVADASGYPIDLIHDCGANIRGRYWRWQLTDTGNPAGYVQAARLRMGRVWSPQRGYAFGASLGYESRDEEERSLGGVLFFDERTPARVMEFTLESLTDVEALGTVLDIQRTRRTSREVVVIPDPDDAQRGFKRNILGRLRTLSPIGENVGRWTASFIVEELL